MPQMRVLSWHQRAVRAHPSPTKTLLKSNGLDGARASPAATLYQLQNILTVSASGSSPTPSIRPRMGSRAAKVSTAKAAPARKAPVGPAITPQRASDYIRKEQHHAGDEMKNAEGGPA